MKIKLILAKKALDELHQQPFMDTKTVDVEIPLVTQDGWQVLGAEWPEEAAKKSGPYIMHKGELLNLGGASIDVFSFATRHNKEDETHFDVMFYMYYYGQDGKAHNQCITLIENINEARAMDMLKYIGVSLAKKNFIDFEQIAKICMNRAKLVSARLALQRHKRVVQKHDNAWYYVIREGGMNELHSEYDYLSREKALKAGREAASKLGVDEFFLVNSYEINTGFTWDEEKISVHEEDEKWVNTSIRLSECVGKQII